MASAVVVRRRRARRIEARIPFTFGADLAFGVALRAPRARRRRRARHRVRSWGAVFTRSALLVANVVAPLAILFTTADLGRLGARVLPSAASAPAPAVAESVPAVPRPVLESRHAVMTVTSPDPPQVRAYLVAAGDTVLSIAARFALAPQTVAYDNGISDTAQLRVGTTLLIPPFDAAIHVMAPGETIAAVAATYALDPETVRTVNAIGSDDNDIVGRSILLPVPDARYPGFRLKVSDAPRVLAPRVRWPVDGVITQLFTPVHTGVDIAAPYGAPIVATDAGTVSFVGWRGDGGLAVCVLTDWGLESCAYHTSVTYVVVGDRVDAGQRVAAIGTTGVTTGPHVHWETRTNGALVDPLTYAPYAGAAPGVGRLTKAP